MLCPFAALTFSRPLLLPPLWLLPAWPPGSAVSEVKSRTDHAQLLWGVGRKRGYLSFLGSTERVVDEDLLCYFNLSKSKEGERRRRREEEIEWQSRGEERRGGDRRTARGRERRGEREGGEGRGGKGRGESRGEERRGKERRGTVSYTHLTLPTICSV
eukprot:2652419-Rhodomonas_salina.1